MSVRNVLSDTGLQGEVRNALPDTGIQGEFDLTDCYWNLLFGQHIGVSDSIYKRYHGIIVDIDLLN